MNKMLNSLAMPVIFLDQEYRIRRYSAHAESIVELIETDVGRPINQLSVKLPDVDLQEEARRVLLDQKPVEKEIKTKNGHIYLLRVMPYPGEGRKITGVVLAFVNLDRLKEMETAWQYAQWVIDTVREPLIVLDKDMKVVSASRSFYDTFQVSPEETKDRRLYDLGNGQWDIPELRELLEKILPKQETFDDFKVEHDFPDIGPKKMLLNARALKSNGEQPSRVLLAIEDLTEEK
jgi:PAS domain-containing protein